MVGSQIGHYKILRSVGKGGMGEVFAAEDTRLHREVAIKFLPKHMSDDPLALERFYREARSASALNHPNICTIHAIDETNGQHYIVMELLTGEPLGQVIESYHAAVEAFPMDRLLRLGIEVCQALASAHEKGITHRDIKPANIFVTERDTVKVLDFGLAIVSTDQAVRGFGPEHSTKLTLPGSTVGTIAYMSPEQARGEESDQRSDLFSFGAVLYEMCTGVVAFQGSTTAVIFDAILNRTPISPAQLNSAVPKRLVHIISRLLEKDKTLRYQSAAEVMRDLREVPADGSGGWKPLPFRMHWRQKLRRIPRWNLAIGILALVLVMAAIGVASKFRSRATRPIASIAVLPFVNETGSRQNDYITGGVTEGIIRSLARNTPIQVTARSTVFRYESKAIDPLVIGHELGVESVLTGRIRKREDSLDIDVELVDTSNGRQLWGEHYRRRLQQLSSLEDDITQDLRLRVLSGGENSPAKSKKHLIADPEAYRLYQLGRANLNKRSADSLHLAADYFDRTIEKDPQAALAYAGLAQVYVLLPQYDPDVRPDVAYVKAKEDARRAIELDGSLSEAYAALGYAKAYADWDLPGAARDFEQAISFNEQDSTARQWYAELLTQQGRSQEAMAQIRRAAESDPQSAIIQHTLGFILESEGKFDAAAEQYKKALALDPRLAVSRIVLADLYFYQHRYDLALSQLQIMAEQADSEPMRQMASSLSKTYAANGAPAMLRQFAALQAQNGGSSSAFFSAQAFAFAGDETKALENLELSASRHEWAVLYMNSFPEFKSLRDLPRFQAIKQRIELD